MTRWQAYVRLIGLCLLGWLAANADWHEIGSTLRALDPGYLVGWAFFFAAMMLVRTARLHFALRRLGYDVPVAHCYSSIVVPALLALVTPGRLGEFTRIGFVRARGVALRHAAVLVLLERAVDTGIFLVVGFAGLAYVSGSAEMKAASWVMALAGLVVLAIAMRLSPRLIHGLRAVLHRSRYAHLLTEGRDAALDSVDDVVRTTSTLVFGVGAVCIALSFAQVVCLARGLGIEAGAAPIVYSTAVAAVVSILPISVGGLGTRETAYVIMLQGAGVTATAAALLSLLDNAILGVLGTVVMGLPAWWGGSPKRCATKEATG